MVIVIEASAASFHSVFRLLLRGFSLAVQPLQFYRYKLQAAAQRHHRCYL